MATQMNPAPSMPGLTGIPRRLALEGVLTEADARQAVEDAAKQKLPVTAYLVENGMVDGLRMAQALSAEFGVPMLDISAVDVTQLPMGELSEVAPDLPTDRTVLCICRSGARSGAATEFLRRQGVDAVNLEGGMLEWADAGRPMVNENGGSPQVV